MGSLAEHVAMHDTYNLIVLVSEVERSLPIVVGIVFVLQDRQIPCQQLSRMTHKHERTGPLPYHVEYVVTVR